MNGRVFVVLVALVAVASAVVIALGVPTDFIETPEVGSSIDAPPEGGSPGERRERRPAPPLGAMVDSSSTASADTAASWAYRRTTVADLDGDGVPERLVLASDVFVTDDGEPVWEDEQRWAVYVEEDDGARTLLYAGRAAPGAVSAAVGAPSDSGGADGSARAIVVVEQDVRRARMLLVAYDGPGRRRFLDATGTRLDAWADRVAEETR